MSNSDKVDHYAVLGVSRDATLKEINAAYKKLALKYHPDKTGGGAKSVIIFRKVQEAVEVLRDPARRQKHDEELGNKTKRRWGFDDSFSAEPGYTGWTPYGGRTYNFSNPRDRYMYSYGTGDHMNPFAKPRDGWAELAEEQARMDREREAFFKTAAQIERERQRRRREGMAARVRRDEEEMARQEQEERETLGDESFFTAVSEQNSETDTGKDKQAVRSSDDSSGEDEYTESEGSDDVKSEEDCDGSDEEESDERTAPDSEQSQNATAEQTTSNSSAERNEEDEDEVDPNYGMDGLVPFFNYKLRHPDHHYTVEDVRTELMGIVLETYCGFLEELRMSFPDAKPITPGQDPESCRHLGMWDKQFLIENCEVCGRWLPLYTLTCPACGKKACIVCKFEQHGDDDSEYHVGQSTVSSINASVADWVQNTFHDSGTFSSPSRA